MKPKTLTFVWRDMTRHTINTIQVSTPRRSTMEAWEEARALLLRRIEGCDPEHLLTLRGLPEVLDDHQPLRAPTKEEIRQLLIEAKS